MVDNSHFLSMISRDILGIDWAWDDMEALMGGGIMMKVRSIMGKEEDMMIESGKKDEEGGMRGWRLEWWCEYV